jgi:hypothetical protein
MQEVRRRTDIRRYHSASTACRYTVSGSFHSPLGVLFTFPSRYLFTIGRLVVFSLGRWSSQIPAGFHVSRRTQVRALLLCQFRLRGYHPLWPSFPAWFSYQRRSDLCTPYNPRKTEVILVWAIPTSLTATMGISIDFYSSGYEDVSTPPVCSSYEVPGILQVGFPIRKSPDQSLIVGSPKLIADYLRPSSPLDAKASSVHPL